MTTIMTWVPKLLDVNGGKVPVDVSAIIKEVQKNVGNATNVRVVPSLKEGYHIYFEGITYHHTDFRDKINFMKTHREHNVLKSGPFIMADFMGTFKVRFVVASESSSDISIYIPKKGHIAIADSPVMPGEVGVTLVAPHVHRNLNPYKAINAFATAEKVTFYPRSPTVSRVVFEGVKFKQNAVAIKKYFEETKSSPSPSGIYVYLSPTSYIVIAAMRTAAVVGGTYIPPVQESQEPVVEVAPLDDEINFDM
jgi:hypothetical protein